MLFRSEISSFAKREREIGRLVSWLETVFGKCVLCTVFRALCFVQRQIVQMRQMLHPMTSNWPLKLILLPPAILIIELPRQTINFLHLSRRLVVVGFSLQFSAIFSILSIFSCQKEEKRELFHSKSGASFRPVHWKWWRHFKVETSKSSKLSSFSSSCFFQNFSQARRKQRKPRRGAKAAEVSWS